MPRASQRRTAAFAAFAAFRLLGPVCVLAAGAAGCARDSLRSSHGESAGHGIAATPPSPPSGVTTGAESSSSATVVPNPAAPTARFGGREIETACNGLDDDGDGLVDALLPVEPNACSTALKGACSRGFAACEDGRRVCLGPAPMPEVFDGVDNDCNGVIDDVPAAVVRPRALVLAPRYAWLDAAPDIADVTFALGQAGIPFDSQAPGTDWSSALATLGRYSLAVVPGYLVGDGLSARAREALETFARKGGVVAIFKPVGTPDEPQAWKLAGLRSSTRKRDVLELRFDGARPPAVTDLDSPEERRVPVNEVVAAGQAVGVEVYALDPDPAEKMDVVAHGVSSAESRPAITRRALGSGAIYAFGHDLSTYARQRCYVNCFEPAGDLLRLVLEGMFRESAAGHVVLKHTVPGEASSMLIVTHDIDAPDADNEGPWGPPGALQVAALELARGVRATFNVTTDYVSGYYNEATMRQLCALGLCPLGAHSVTHTAGFAGLPLGTCTETRATYTSAKSVCGEIRVSRDLLQALMGRPPRVWRSPYLVLPPHLFEELAKNGFSYDSGFGVGDLPYNLPIDLETVGFHQDRYEHAPIVEFPIALEDGRAERVGDATSRVELSDSTRARFETLWDYTALRNVQNRSYTTLLLHPSRGRDMPPENLRRKLEILDAFEGRALALDLVARPLEEAGDFWRARLGVQLDATYGATGYAGTLVVGKLPVTGLTLEFGDAVREFTCAACGRAALHGKRVVLADMLPAGTRASFVASVR
jgi:hypothetical protein